jgi:hypothetical protein
MGKLSKEQLLELKEEFKSVHNVMPKRFSGEEGQQPRKNVIHHSITILNGGENHRSDPYSRKMTISLKSSN